MLGRGLQAHAHEVGLDGQLAPAAVDQHRELNEARAPVVDENVHSRAHRAAGVEHVVHQHHRPALDALLELGRANLGFGQPVEDVVAVEGDVDGAQVGPLLATLDEQLDHAFRQPRTTGADADEVGVLPGPLDDFEGEPP